jgi:hypothetical protein
MKTDPRCPDHPNIPAIVAHSGNQPHAAALRCPECDRWLKWLSKFDPRTQNVAIRSPKEEVKQLLIFE